MWDCILQNNFSLYVGPAPPSLPSERPICVCTLSYFLSMSWPEFWVDQSSSSTQIDENSLKVRM